jgi:signal peptidase I
MSATDDNENLVSGHYDGELVARKPLTAFALGLIAPGLGWAYMGRGIGAVAVNLLFVLVWAALAVAWLQLKFFPVPVVLAALAGTVGLTLMSAADAAAAAEKTGARYVIRSSNNPLIYALIAVFSYVLPLAGVYRAVVPSLMSVAVVTDDAMYPTLLPGDRLLVDRTAVGLIEPQPGHVVLYRRNGAEGTLDIGRVVAGPGDSIAIVDGIVFVDDAPSPQGDLSEAAVAEVGAIVGPPDDDLHVRLESNGDAIYLVSMPLDAWWGEPTERTLAAGEFFVLHDNRSNLDDSRTFGPIAHGDLVGSPLFVGYSGAAVTTADLTAPIVAHFGRAAAALFVSPHDGPRAARSGRLIQPVAADSSGLRSRGRR